MLAPAGMPQRFAVTRAQGQDVALDVARKEHAAGRRQDAARRGAGAEFVGPAGFAGFVGNCPL